MLSIAEKRLQETSEPPERKKRVLQDTADEYAEVDDSAGAIGF